MTTCIISDIHGNLPALEAVFREGERLGADEWICLGDVAGYGANPNECIELIRSRCDVCLLGNHDEAAREDSSVPSFNPLALEAILWTRSELTASSRDFLSTLPLRHETESATYVHSTPVRPEAWRYIRGYSDAQEYAEGFTTRFCFVGHSHVPGAYSVSIDSVPKMLVNVGSVGQPRDGDPRAAFVVVRWDTEKPATNKPSMELIRTGYDVEEARRRILDAGLPRTLGDRLLAGR